MKLVSDLESFTCNFPFVPKGFNTVFLPLNTYSSFSECEHIRWSCEKLSPQPEWSTSQLILEQPEVLTPQLGLTHFMEYCTQTKGTEPVRLAPYRLSPHKIKFIHYHLNGLLQEGVTEHSSYSRSMLLFQNHEGCLGLWSTIQQLMSVLRISQYLCQISAWPSIGSPRPNLHSLLFPLIHRYGKQSYKTYV